MFDNKCGALCYIQQKCMHVMFRSAPVNLGAVSSCIIHPSCPFAIIALGRTKHPKLDISWNVLLGNHWRISAWQSFSPFFFSFFFFNCDLLTWFQLGASLASSRFVLFLNSRRFLFCLRCMENCSSVHFFYYYYFVDALFGIPALVVMSIWSGLSRRRAFETSHP